MGVLNEEQNTIRLLKEELQLVNEKVANLEYNVHHLHTVQGSDKVVTEDAPTEYMTSERKKRMSIADGEAKSDVSITPSPENSEQKQQIKEQQGQIEAIHHMMKELQEKMSNYVHIDKVNEMISSEVNRVLLEKQSSFSHLDTALNSIQEGADINEESLRDVNSSLMLDLENCPTISHVKSHVLFHLHKHALSKDRIQDGHNEENIIQITPYDYIPLERSLVRDTCTRLNDATSSCDTREMLVQTILSEIKILTNRHSGKKTEDGNKEEEERRKLLDTIRTATEAFKTRIYNLETQDTLTREELKKIKQDHEHKALIDDTNIQEVKNSIEDTKVKLETLISKSISREEFEYSKEMIKVTDGRIDFVTETMNNLELDCLKRQDAHTLLEEGEVSYSNKFLPKLKEIVGKNFEANREFLDRKSTQALNEAIGEVKKSIDFRLEAVNSRVEKHIGDSLDQKLGDIEQSNIYLKGCVSNLDAITTKHQQQLDEQWAHNAKDVENLSSKRSEEEKSRKEWKILDQNIQKLFNDQVQLREKIVNDLDNMSALIAKVPSISDIDSAVNNRFQKWEDSLGKLFDDINLHIDTISYSLNSKAEREDVMNVISDNILKLKKTLLSSIGNDNNEAPALSVGCISCGRGRQQMKDGSPPRNRYSSPLATGSVTAGGESTLDADSSIISQTTGYDQLNLSVGEDSFSREDYEQVLSVMKGEAGLQYLSKQYVPMRPKPNSYLRRGQNELEPLYRRAKYAAQLRESVKVPSLSVNRATSSSVMYTFQDRPRTTGSLPSKESNQIMSMRKGKGGISTFKPYGNNGGLSGFEEPELGSTNNSPVRLLNMSNSAKEVRQQPLTNQQIAMAHAVRSSGNKEGSNHSLIPGDASIDTFGDDLTINSAFSSQKKQQMQPQQKNLLRTSPTRYS